MGPVVTLSAALGAGGSIVGPAVAERLGVAFLDRAIPVAVSRALAVPLDEALARDDRAEHGVGRVLAAFAHPATLTATAMAPPPTHPPTEREFKEQCEQAICELARAGGVVLGRAGAVVLADAPGALHVRLDGPEDARLAAVMRAEGLDEDAARELQRDADRSRAAYVSYFYGARADDPSLYHLVIDSTAVGHEACVEMIVAAARARARAADYG